MLISPMHKATASPSPDGRYRRRRMAATLSALLLAAALSALCGAQGEQAQPPPDLAWDPVVERLEAWGAHDPDRYKPDRDDRVVGERVAISLDDKITHGTPRALRLAWKKDLGDIAGTCLPKTPQVPAVWIKLPEDLDLSKYTRLTFWAKIAGGRHGHLHVGFSNEPAIWGKDVKCHVNNSPLDAGDWSRYTVSLGHLDAAERKAYRWFGIASINVGYQPDEQPVLDVWLDDFVLSAQPLRKWEGWEADPGVVIVSQAGFRRFDEKLGVVDGANPAPEFVVRRVDNGAEAFKGRLQLVQSVVGKYKIADFTRLTQPGRYVIEAGTLKSLAFPIGDDAYRPCIELLSDWVFNMRCGCKTALHDACHTDDGIYVRYQGEGKERKEISRQPLDLVGGWHDAGDVRTYYFYTFWTAYQDLRAREAGWRRDRDGDGTDDLLDSAAWGIRHLAKIRNPATGEFFEKIADWPDYRRGNYWSDGKAGTPDDRHLLEKTGDTPANVGMAAASAALFARTAGPEHRAVAEAALKAAEERWAVWFDPEKGKAGFRSQPDYNFDHGHGYNLAKCGQGALQLYLQTKKPEYLETARHFAERILAAQRRTFYPGGPRPLCGDIFSWHRNLTDRDLPEEYLADLVLELPEGFDYYRYRAALVRTANWWMKPTRHFWRPFSVPHLEGPKTSFKEGFLGVPIETSPDTGATRYLVPTADLQVCDTAGSLQRVAQALNDLELERLARWQVHWTVGHNPFNVSWVCGFGEDSIDQYYSFSQGRMPGSVSGGFGIGADGIPHCVRPYGGESWTRYGEWLMRAMVAVSQPARVRLTLREGDAPWKGKARIVWPVTGETVSEGETDAEGALPEIALDGGQRYEVRCGKARVPLAVVSGNFYTRTIDLTRVLVLTAETPRYVMPKEPFTIRLKVANLGTKPAETALTVHAEDATTEVPKQTVKVGAGETKTVDWPFRAGEGGRPYVLFFEPDGDRASGLDVTGAILP